MVNETRCIVVKRVLSGVSRDHRRVFPSDGAITDLRHGQFGCDERHNDGFAIVISLRQMNLSNLSHHAFKFHFNVLYRCNVVGPDCLNKSFTPRK